MCEECYSDENRITPLLNPLDCLENHTQYICGTCGRCICIEHDLNLFLKKNKDKKCRQMMPVFSAGKYKEYPHTEVRKLTPDEIKQYMSER